MHAGKALVECVLAFILARGLQRTPKAPCPGSGCLTRHSHEARVRLGGLTLGQHSLVTMLTRCGLPWPPSLLADEKPSRGLSARVSLPPIVRGRGIWHLGASESKSAAACTESYGVLQRAALAHEPSSQVRDALTDGFESTTKSRRTLFPGTCRGFCLRHALNNLPDKLRGVSASGRQGVRSKFHALLQRCRQRKSLRVVALGQRLR
jgi:hypothetical protein